MKILLVSEIWTHPIDMGNKRLIVDQALYLQRLGHEVHFLFVDLSLRYKPLKYKLMKDFWGDRLHILSTSFVRKGISNLRLKFSQKFRKGFISADELYFNGIHEEINRLDNQYKFDCCIINYFYMSKALEHISIPRKALLTHDIFADRNKHSECSVMSTSSKEEAKAAMRAQFILTVQNDDAKYFKQIAPGSTVIATFSTFDYHPSEIVGNKTILYLSGNAKFNISGFKWFLNNVWNKLTERISEIKLLVGGGICEALTDEKLPDNIELAGYIENVEYFYSQGDIFINPTYQGTGLKIKTLESVARDKVSITRTHNRIGLFEGTEIPIFFSDNPDEWIDYISAIISNYAAIDKIKKCDERYIKEINDFIDNQYNTLLK